MVHEFIHVLGVIVFGFATYWQFWQIRVPGKDFPAMVAFPGRWKYLTIWNLVLQLAYNAFSLMNDRVGSNELNRRRQTFLQKIRDSLFASWVFPASVFVSLTFWILYAIDRELVFPKVVDAFYPSWLNHAVHTGPIIFVALELIYVPKILPSRSKAIFGTLALTTTYLAWITWVYTVTGFWPYPILQILNNFQRTLFLAALALALLGLYFVGENVTRRRWGESLDAPKNSKTAPTGGRGVKGKSLTKVKKGV